MRHYATAIGCVAISALTLLGSPMARADDASFVRDVESLGVTLSPPNLISTGQSACYFLRRNRDLGQIEERIVRYLRVEPDRAHQFFVLAINEYCPEYRGVAEA